MSGGHCRTVNTLYDGLVCLTVQIQGFGATRLRLRCFPLCRTCRSGTGSRIVQLAAGLVSAWAPSYPAFAPALTWQFRPVLCIAQVKRPLNGVPTKRDGGRAKSWAVLCTRWRIHSLLLITEVLQCRRGTREIGCGRTGFLHPVGSGPRVRSKEAYSSLKLDRSRLLEVHLWLAVLWFPRRTRYTRWGQDSFHGGKN